MMLNRLTLTALCFTMLVRGQTQVDLNKQVRNALPIPSGGTQAANQIDARKNVGTPHLVATDFPGADIGAKVNNAFASFPATTCGTVLIPPGEYTQTTSILVKTGCTLEGAKGWAVKAEGGFSNNNIGTVLAYNGAAATSAVYLMDTPETLASNNAAVKNLSFRSMAPVCTDTSGFGANLEWNTATSSWQCVNYGTPKTIATTTNATPIVVTAAAHGLSTGDRVLVTGVQCNVTAFLDTCAANGHRQVTVIDANTFSLNGSAGNGGYISGGVVEKLAWSGALPHLAAIQHGLTNPVGTLDGRFNRIENIYINAGTNGVFPQGGFHMGVFMNGCEDCSIADVTVQYADFGFAFGPATQPASAYNLAARVSKLAGYQYNGAKVTCVDCLAESNQWFSRFEVNHTLARRYGAAVRVGGKFPGDTTQTIDGIKFIHFYREANDIDFLGEPNSAGSAVDTDGAGAGGLFADQGNFIGRMLGCGTLNTASTTVPGVFETDCTFSGAAPPRTPGALTYLVVQKSPGVEIGASTKITDTLGVGYELRVPTSGGNTDLFIRSQGNSSKGLHLHPFTAADAIVNQAVSSATLDFGASVWNGVSADLLTAKMQAGKVLTNGAADTSRAVWVGFSDPIQSTRNFSFREKSVFRISHNNVGDTPRLEIGAGDHPTLPPEDNTSPTIQFSYKSADGSTSPHLRSYSLNGSNRLDVNTGILQLVDNSGGNIPITFRTKPSFAQTANQQEWGDSSGNVTSFVSSSGALALAPTGAQPACDSSHRFWLWTTAGSAGVKDKVEVCAKDAADAYAWRAIF